MRHLIPLLLLLVACGDKDKRAARQEADKQMCAEAIENGWGASQLGNPQQTCENKMGELRGVIMGSVVQDEIRPCIHGGTPRFCWVQSNDQSLRIWWSIHNQYTVHPDDRENVERHITRL